MERQTIKSRYQSITYSALIFVSRMVVLVWADILAGYAVRVTMTYLTNVWKLNFTHAALIINVFMGVSNMMPIFMVFLVDSFTGDYVMLLLSSLAYSYGLSSLAMSTPPVLSNVAGNCSAYQPDCIGNTQKVLFFTALALIAVGFSGHMTSLKSFLAFQTKDKKTLIDPQRGTQNDPEIKTPWQFMGALSIVVVVIIGGIALAYIKPWSVRYGIPAICTVVATLFFLSGSSSYKHETPQGKLCRATLVEETKITLRMILMWMAFIVCGVVLSIGNTYFLEQANHMNHKVGHLKVPLPIFLIFYDMAKFPFTKTKALEKYAPPVGFVVAMIFSILCCITAAKVETRRLDVLKSHGLIDKPAEKIPMTIFWLLPQFLLLGALDGISQKSITCLCSDQVPPSMSHYLRIFTTGVRGAGILGSVLSVHIAGKVSEMGGKPSWFQDTLNKSRLDNYYWMLSVLSCVNLVFFIFVAIWYAR